MHDGQEEAAEQPPLCPGMLQHLVHRRQFLRLARQAWHVHSLRRVVGLAGTAITVARWHLAGIGQALGFITGQVAVLQAQLKARQDIGGGRVPMGIGPPPWPGVRPGIRLARRADRPHGRQHEGARVIALDALAATARSLGCLGRQQAGMAGGEGNGGLRDQGSQQRPRILVVPNGLAVGHQHLGRKVGCGDGLVADHGLGARAGLRVLPWHQAAGRERQAAVAQPMVTDRSVDGRIGQLQRHAGSPQGAGTAGPPVRRPAMASIETAFAAGFATTFGNRPCRPWCGPREWQPQGWAGCS